MPATTPRSPDSQGRRLWRDWSILPEVAAGAAEIDRLLNQTGKSPKQIVTATDNAFSVSMISRWRRGVDNLIPSDEKLAILFELAGEPADGRQRVAFLVAKARRAKADRIERRRSAEAGLVVQGGQQVNRQVGRTRSIAATLAAVGVLAVPQILSDTDSSTCQQRARFRVTAPANVTDENKTTIGRAAEGDVFVVLDEPVHVSYRRYGAIGNDGLTGYVLIEKLEFVDTVTVCT
jgi:hypothetical protein